MSNRRNVRRKDTWAYSFTGHCGKKGTTEFMMVMMPSRAAGMFCFLHRLKH